MSAEIVTYNAYFILKVIGMVYLKKVRLSVALQAVVIIAAMLLLFWLSVKSNQSIMAMPIQEKFIGEYSFDGGNFEYELMEGDILNFYLDHITVKGKV